MGRDSKIDSQQKAIASESLDVRSRSIRVRNQGAASTESVFMRMLAKARTSPGTDSPALTGTPTAPTASPDTNTSQVATTAFVLAQAGSSTPEADSGSGAAGTSLRYSREDHVHPVEIVWDDIQGPAYAAQFGLSAPTIEAYRDTPARLIFYRHDQDDAQTFTYQLPHRWIRDTEVRAHIHYIPMVTPASNEVVRLRYTYSWAHPDGELPAMSSWTQSTVDITVPSSGADTFNKKITTLFTNTPSGSKESSMLVLHLERLGSSSGSDTYTTGKASGTAQANFCVMSVDLHFQTNKDGTTNPIPS